MALINNIIFILWCLASITVIYGRLIDSIESDESLPQTESDSICDDGWLLEDKKCYKIEETKAKKDAAKKICEKAHGAKLSNKIPTDIEKILYVYSKNEPIRLESKCQKSDGNKEDCDEDEEHAFLCVKSSKKGVTDDAQNVNEKMLKKELNALDSKFLTDESKTIQELQSSVKSLGETTGDHKNKLTIIESDIESINSKNEKITSMIKEDITKINEMITPGHPSFKLAAPVKVTRTPKEPEIKIKSGDTLELKCEYTGYPEATIVWTHDGSVKHFCANKTICPFRNVLPADTGRYSCTVDNDVGFHQTETFDVVITHKPIIEFNKNVYFGDIGQDLEIMAKVTGFPKPTLKWYFNEVTQLSSEISAQEEGRDFKFVIKSVSRERFGTYTLRAENEGGSTTKDVIVKGSPPRNIEIGEPIIYRDGDVLKCNINMKVESGVRITKFVANYFDVRLPNDWFHSKRGSEDDILKRRNKLTYEHIIHIDALDYNRRYQIEVSYENEFGKSDFESREFQTRDKDYHPKNPVTTTTTTTTKETKTNTGWIG